MNICTFDGCTTKIHCSGLCQMHFRQKRMGQKLRPKKTLHFGNAKSRIADRFTVNESTGCHEWTGLRTSANYGRVVWNAKHYLAHRLSYIAFVGKIPRGKIVCHTCDNPPCVNHKHLFIGTHKSNAEDKVQKRRHPLHKRDACLRGHKYEGNNLMIWHTPRGTKARLCRICHYSAYVRRRKRLKEQGLNSRGQPYKGIRQP